ncbi:SoxR reducing system RseC family protein [candidate division WOR-3 bacterium]|uniref:Fis family transcriptional regulator n=1 Tax=candidate division TA06 bacterium TaxID=2250710 RepID=A0A660S5X3_UNCT6|nr:SoxR reducing system RseC family protein [candidate division WOR-3 bacterium]RKX65057.1 MAG: hypothetical protein DRP44_07105 [candidate division TA06 bacterium]
MIEMATVIETYDNGTAKITIVPQDACKTCPLNGTCSNWVSRESLHYIVNNNIGASKNDTVKVEFSEKHLVTHSFIVYIVPLISLFLGAYIGKIFFSETVSILLGFAALGITFFIIALFDKKMKDPFKGEAKIVEIVTEPIKSSYSD